MDNEVIVNDIGLAAYLKVVKGFPYAEVPYRETDSRKFIFKFDISEADYTEARTAYLNSDFRKMDSEIKELKKILNS
jgi:hypothetical protein